MLRFISKRLFFRIVGFSMMAALSSVYAWLAMDKQTLILTLLTFLSTFFYNVFLVLKSYTIMVYTYDASISTRNQRVNQGDANISASINASTRKGNRSFFLCLRLCLRRCVARVNRDNASISTRKQRSSQKLSTELCSVFKTAACTSAILDLTFWRQNFNLQRLCMSPCAYTYRLCKQPCTYACFVRIFFLSLLQCIF